MGLTDFLLAPIADPDYRVPMACVNCGRAVEPDGSDGEFGHVAAALPGGHPAAENFWADPCPDPDPLLTTSEAAR